jgi:glutamyl-tRNA synthetase
MNYTKVRVRFAPSPTGELHIGNARTALYNFLFARKHGGVFVLRIEDTDRERSSDVYKNHLLEDLCWLNITWDEGPDKGGAAGPYVQSQRNNLYQEYLRILIDQDLAYPCFCSEEELEAARKEMLTHRIAPRYSGKCRHLKPEDQERLIREGRKPAYRFRVRQGAIGFADHIRGPMQFDGEAIGDFIVMRSNGQPAYNFAAVIDDHLMQITHIIRGEDHLTNTASQLLLYEALHFTPPEFYHHSLILGTDRTKLSKRHGAVSVSEFRRQGFLPEAMVNYLSLLGNFLGEGKEVCSLGEIILLFDAEKLGKGGAVFDLAKLQWINNIYLRKYDIDQLEQLIEPILKKAAINNVTQQKIRDFAALIQPNINTLGDAEDYLGIITEEKFDLSPDARHIMQEEGNLAVVSGLHDILVASTDMGVKELKDGLRKLSAQTGKKGKDLYLPIRVGITGMTVGPELDVLFAFLGREGMRRRLEIVMQKLSSN